MHEPPSKQKILSFGGDTEEGNINTERLSFSFEVSQH